jgi:cystathionine beta-lyase
VKEKSTRSVHAGTLKDAATKGLNTPIYTSTAYAYIDQPQQFYPRYFNVPNQQAVIEKLCALEEAESGLVFSSGMAAITTTLLAHLRAGDHIVFQAGVYGGTHHFAVHELEKFGIEYSFTEGTTRADFERALQPNTKIIYVETPSNPLLSIVDLEIIGALARGRRIMSVIDNTFASPINQNPLAIGIDVVMHSGTKYLGGHSDICCGAVLSSAEVIAKIRRGALSFGGSLNAETCYLLERSLKTLELRVGRQNENALAVALALAEHDAVARVFYPGLESHPDHDVARRQMSGYGGVLSFELKQAAPLMFLNNLRLIEPAMSLGGVETTVCQPAMTSHVKLTRAERLKIGITDGLLRLSVGIEDARELIADIKQALHSSLKAGDDSSESQKSEAADR